MSSQMNADKEAAEFTKLYTEVSEIVKAELKKKGISIKEKPNFSDIDIDVSEEGEPNIPYDITILSLDDIGRYYSICHAWLAYLGPQFSLADVEATAWKEVREFMWSRIRQEVDGTKSDKDDYTRNNARFIRVNARWLMQSTQYEIIKNKYNLCKEFISMLSREVSRRQAEVELIKTDNSMENRLNYFKKQLHGLKKDKIDKDATGEEIIPSFKK